MSRTSRLVAVVVVVVCGPWLLRADGPVPENPSGLTAEAVVITLKDKTTFDVQQCLVKTLGGNAFIVATPIGSPWRGRRIWIPVSEVKTIYEFDSVEALQSRYDRPSAPSVEKVELLGVEEPQIPIGKPQK